MTAQMNRDEILRRFEQLLDSALAEEAPAGIDPEILAALNGDDTSGAGAEAQDAVALRR